MELDAVKNKEWKRQKDGKRNKNKQQASKRMMIKYRKISWEGIVIKEKFGINDDQEEIKDQRRRLKLSSMYDWKSSEEM